MVDGLCMRGFIFVNIKVGPYVVFYISHIKAIRLPCMVDHSSMPRTSNMVGGASIEGIRPCIAKVLAWPLMHRQG